MASPTPAGYEFSADDEKAMRRAQRAANYSHQSSDDWFGRLRAKEQLKADDAMPPRATDVEGGIDPTDTAPTDSGW